MEAKDLILPAALALGGFFVVRTVMSRRAEAAATLPSRGGGKELPSGGGGGRVSGGGSASSGRPIDPGTREAGSTRQPAGAELQRHLNALRDVIRSGAQRAYFTRSDWPNAPLVVDGDVGPATQRVYDAYKAALGRTRMGIEGFATFSALPALDPHNSNSVRNASTAVNEVVEAVGSSTERRQALATLFGGR